MALKLTKSVVEAWLSLVSGRFSTRDMWNEIGIDSGEGKQHLRVILNRFEKEGKLVSLGSGVYCKVSGKPEKMDWEAADLTNLVSLKFPFNIEEFVKIYPKTIIIVAGDKNSGKTTFLLNLVVMNMNSFSVDLYNSEQGKEQLKERLLPFNISNPAPFDVYEAYDNFGDYIDPDKISVIDYLDLNSEVYLVGEEIDKIFRKLKKGVAVIGLQKPPPFVTYVKGQRKVISRDLAYGAGFTIKRAALYISLSANRLKLVYVKTPRTPSINPNNMQWSFTIDKTGSKFEDIEKWYGEKEGE